MKRRKEKRINYFKSGILKHGKLVRVGDTYYRRSQSGTMVKV